VILHLCRSEKFIPDFYEFCKNNFENFNDKHYFYIRGNSQFNQINSSNVYMSDCNKNYLSFIKLLKLIFKADKIILHGLFDAQVIFILSLRREFCKKSYHFCWGAEIYQFINHELGQSRKKYLKKLITLFVLRRIRYFVTHIKGDYDLAKSKLGISGKYIPCNLYPSNIVSVEYNQSNKFNKDGCIHILVGNSADSSNNHSEIFDQLKHIKSENYVIHCPLSYGDEEYKSKIIKTGYSLFGERFRPLLNFLPAAEYNNFLASVDIAIFHHNRQQALGNILKLLAMGKKVYVRPGTTTWTDLSKLGAKLFMLNALSLERIKERESIANRNVILKHYSSERLFEQLQYIFGGEENVSV
jgi:dTDP-N-acetylfucosamine:lipid II N-acetylfucosaminyltransferase